MKLVVSPPPHVDTSILPLLCIKKERRQQLQVDATGPTNLLSTARRQLVPPGRPDPFGQRGIIRRCV